jgi:hypothetical protein
MAGRGRVDKELVERLRTVPLFSGCSTRELASLSQFLKMVDSRRAGRSSRKEPPAPASTSSWRERPR